MTPQPTAERRRHVRRPLSSKVRLFHVPTGRYYPARSVDASEGGMLMYVPVTAPVAPGQAVQVHLEQVQRADLDYLPCEAVDATIVRVDRPRMLGTGHLPIGVEFSTGQSPD